MTIESRELFELCRQDWRTKHGMESTAEYHAWSAMIQRCTNPNNPNYKNYGGRGIKVHEPWRDFSNFIIDMGRKPSSKHTLDRKNVNGNYEPSNCRWITQKQQCNNLRKNVLLTHNNKTMTISEWADHTGIKYDTLYIRLYRGWDVGRALTKGVIYG